MKSHLVVLLVTAAAIAGSTSGCTTANGPTGGLLYSHLSGPVAITANASEWGYNGHSSASAWSVLGLVTVGDASIEAAKKNGSPQNYANLRLSHADYTWDSLFGVGKYSLKIFYYDPRQD